MKKRGKAKGKWNIGNIWKNGMPPAIKKKISERAKERYKTRTIWNKNRKWSKAVRLKISKARKRNPNLVRQMTLISRARFNNPNFHKLLDRKCTEFWRNHPNLKKEYSIKFRQYYKTHPEALKDLLSYGEKSKSHYLKTKQGFRVKSRGERQIANFLWLAKIICLYESIPLMFSEMICIPDFYLPQENIFIEFYGGHPKSWKRKVKKNKLYKKYKIPCIFITPAELNNLNYYLLKEAEKIKSKPTTKNFNIHKWIKMVKI